MRLVAFIIIVLVTYSAPLPLFLVASAVYVLLYPGYELLVLAFFVDAEFGVSTIPFVYTLTVACLIVFGLFIKPHLRIYASSFEK